jgi:vacuolar-type H+-ATPase subunit E/Vma4
MREHPGPFGQEFRSDDSDPADPVIETLSARLREAQDRINQLEREANGIGDQLLAEAKAIIQEVRCNADARVNQTIREADERSERLKAEAQNEIARLQDDLAQATCGIKQVQDEADRRIQSVKMEADARVDAVETEAKKSLDVIRRENQDKVLRLEADLREAKNRADNADQWIMLVRREIEDHLMPVMRDGPKLTNSAAWVRRLWFRVTHSAALGCRDLF